MSKSLSMIYKWPISYPVLFPLSCNHKLTVYFDWPSFYLLVMSFWPFHELNKHFSFPSYSLTWLTVFVCWDNQFFTHSSAGLSLADFFSFPSTAVRSHRRESESKLWLAYSVISSTHLSLTRHWSLRERFRHEISVTAACLCLVQKRFSSHCRWGKSCNDLCSFVVSASLRLKQKNYSFCREDLLFDTVTCPQRY